MASDVVDETAVYLTTGNPLPSDIESVVDWLLNDPFVTAFQSELLVGTAGFCNRLSAQSATCPQWMLLTLLTRSGYVLGCCNADCVFFAAQAREAGKTTSCCEPAYLR